MAWPVHPAHRFPGDCQRIFRIGEQFATRFPLEPRGVEATRRWLESEAEAARELLGRTRFPTPEPVAIDDSRGRLRVSMVRADLDTGHGGHRPRTHGHSVALARDLAKFISEVRAIGTRGRAYPGTPVRRHPSRACWARRPGRHALGARSTPLHRNDLRRGIDWEARVHHPSLPQHPHPSLTERLPFSSADRPPWLAVHGLIPRGDRP